MMTLGFKGIRCNTNGPYFTVLDVGTAMMKKPVGERRTPTDLWAGLGFSRSMPDAEIRNWLDRGLCYRGSGMSTTYEV